MIWCPFGNVRDERGCPTCQCNPRPANLDPTDPRNFVMSKRSDDDNQVKEFTDEELENLPMSKRAILRPTANCDAVCMVWCPFGNILDKRGCPTCGCNPRPANLDPNDPRNFVVSKRSEDDNQVEELSDEELENLVASKRSSPILDSMIRSRTVCINAPLCTVYCPYGSKLDARGCPTCQCKDRWDKLNNKRSDEPEEKSDEDLENLLASKRFIANGNSQLRIARPICLNAPICAVYCPYGNVYDSKGCPTCQCKQAGEERDPRDPRNFIASKRSDEPEGLSDEELENIPASKRFLDNWTVDRPNPNTGLLRCALWCPNGYQIDRKTGQALCACHNPFLA